MLVAVLELLVEMRAAVSQSGRQCTKLWQSCRHQRPAIAENMSEQSWDCALADKSKNHKDRRAGRVCHTPAEEGINGGQVGAH